MALLLYKVNGKMALLVLIEISLNSINGPLVLNSQPRHQERNCSIHNTSLSNSFNAKYALYTCSCLAVFSLWSPEINEMSSQSINLSFLFYMCNVHI